MLFGSNFTTERYKEDGTIERTKSSDLHCYLVGETESFYSSVAISDCDGLVRIVYVQFYCSRNSDVKIRSVKYGLPLRKRKGRVRPWLREDY